MMPPKQVSWLTVGAILSIYRPLPHDVFFDIESLGHTDQYIRMLEDQLRPLLAAPAKSEEAMLSMSMQVTVRGFSEQWIFALYERLRTQRDVDPSKRFVGKLMLLNPFFDKLARLRMPIAKNEVQGGSNKNKTPDFPIPLFDTSTGSAGWQIKDKDGGAPVVLLRREMADEFLQAIVKCK